jgi:LDH2 family malate/lactate/ureidoglycolate dehydrogenase
MAPVNVPHRTLHALVAGLFAARGMSPEDARTVADVLVWANLRGVDSHGVSRVPRYMELFDTGEANPRPNLQVERLRSALAVVDADRAPGPVALTRAMREAIDLARDAGVAWVAVRGNVHSGAIGYYTTWPPRPAWSGSASSPACRTWRTRAAAAPGSRPARCRWRCPPGLLIPGERGDRAFRERTAAGVPLPPEIWATLTDQASVAGVAVPGLS